MRVFLEHSTIDFSLNNEAQVRTPIATTLRVNNIKQLQHTAEWKTRIYGSTFNVYLGMSNRLQRLFSFFFRENGSTEM